MYRADCPEPLSLLPDRSGLGKIESRTIDR